MGAVTSHASFQTLAFVQNLLCFFGTVPHNEVDDRILGNLIELVREQPALHDINLHRIYITQEHELIS